MENKELDIMDWIHNSIYYLEEMGSRKEDIVISCNILIFDNFILPFIDANFSETINPPFPQKKMFGVTLNVKDHYMGVVVYDYIHVRRLDKKFKLELPLPIKHNREYSHVENKGVFTENNDDLIIPRENAMTWKDIRDYAEKQMQMIVDEDKKKYSDIAKGRIMGIYHVKDSIDETETYMEYGEAKEIGEHDKSQMFHLYSQGGKKVLHNVCFNTLKNEYDKWF